MRAQRNMALKPYLEAIRRTCEPLSHHELLEMILTMAREEPSARRDDFLHRLQALRPGAEPAKAAPSFTLKEILKDIDKLERAILKRIKDIENGDFNDWDEDDFDYRGSRNSYGYYDDEDIDMLGDDHKAELASLFEEAGGLFLQGDLDGARDIFARLFLLMARVEDASGYTIDWDMDLREPRARYCRCVYECADPAERVQKMLSAMEIEVRDLPYQEEPAGDFPLLQDVIDSRPGDLPDFAAFLPAWEKNLAGRGYKNKRLASLLLEAAFLRGGLAEVSRLAHKWRDKQPLGYLSWLARLEEASAWQDLKEAATEALTALPAGRQRAAAAQFLIIAGGKLNDDPAILAGKRERFAADPDAFSLLALVTEAGRQQGRAQELTFALKVLAQARKDTPDLGVLRAKTLLMAGRLDEAFALAEKEKAVGWSFGSTAGIAFAAILHLSCGSSRKCELADSMLRDYARDTSFLYETTIREDDEIAHDFYQEILAGLAMSAPKPADLARYRKWAQTIGEKRVNEIARNKHRNAYDRAARVLASLAEVLAAAGEPIKALALLQEYCKTRFNRHTAFRNEVRQAVKTSLLLKDMAAGL
ncbi:MAG: hypothetical protein ACOY3O_12465 [Thermodesulfobacteriota bacterium]